MRFIKFPEADTIIGLGQKGVNPLPAKFEAHNRGRVLMVAELNDEDLEQIRKDRRIYIELLTHNHPMQPIKVSAFAPEDISRGKIQLRVNYNSDAPEPDHTGHYVIKGYLPAKTKMDCSSLPVKNDSPDRKSWQNIHKTKNRTEHVEELKKLLSSGEYEMEAE